MNNQLSQKEEDVDVDDRTDEYEITSINIQTEFNKKETNENVEKLKINSFNPDGMARRFGIES